MFTKFFTQLSNLSIVFQLVCLGRDAGGQKNLAKKTLVDERFLIWGNGVNNYLSNMPWLNRTERIVLVWQLYCDGFNLIMHVLLKWATSQQNQQFKICAQGRLRSAGASAQSDQCLLCPHEQTLGPQLPNERTAKTDQTGRMPRLIWVFAGHTGHFVGLSWGGSKVFLAYLTGIFVCKEKLSYAGGVRQLLCMTSEQMRIFDDNWWIILDSSPQHCFYGEITKIIPKFSSNTLLICSTAVVIIFYSSP